MPSTDHFDRDAGIAGPITTVRSNGDRYRRRTRSRDMNALVVTGDQLTAHLLLAGALLIVVQLYGLFMARSYARSPEAEILGNETD